MPGALVRFSLGRHIVRARFVRTHTHTLSKVHDIGEPVKEEENREGGTSEALTIRSVARRSDEPPASILFKRPGIDGVSF